MQEIHIDQYFYKYLWILPIDKTCYLYIFTSNFVKDS